MSKRDDIKTQLRIVAKAGKMAEQQHHFADTEPVDLDAVIIDATEKILELTKIYPERG